jgi:hypothetical protein
VPTDAATSGIATRHGACGTDLLTVGSGVGDHFQWTLTHCREKVTQTGRIGIVHTHRFVPIAGDWCELFTEELSQCCERLGQQLDQMRTFDSVALNYFNHLRTLLRWMDSEGYKRFDELDATALSLFKQTIAARTEREGKPPVSW